MTLNRRLKRKERTASAKTEVEGNRIARKVKTTPKDNNRRSTEKSKKQLLLKTVKSQLLWELTSLVGQSLPEIGEAENSWKTIGPQVRRKSAKVAKTEPEALAANAISQLLLSLTVKCRMKRLRPLMCGTRATEGPGLKAMKKARNL